MNPRDFVFWLQGHFELVAKSNAPGSGWTADQVGTVERHLADVFRTVAAQTPEFPPPDPVKGCC